ncbi:MAG: hypothetical protein ACK2UW_01460 [Anaerolineales bacterium]|jgi:hypothetical protein
MIDWWRLLLAALVSMVVSILLIALVRPAAIGLFAGLIAAAWVARVHSTSDGALVCSVAALPAGVYFGIQAGLDYPNPTGVAEPIIMVAAPLLGAVAYAALGSLFGALIGFLVNLAQKGRFPFF